MITKKRLKLWIKSVIFGIFFVLISISGVSALTGYGAQNVYAVDGEEVEVEDITNEQVDPVDIVNQSIADEVTSGKKDTCKDSLGAIGWLVCPVTGKIAEAVDWLYEKIEEMLIIDPISTEDGSPIYEIWKYLKGITNIAFIVFLLVVIYSQITGLGINNYGIKKALPKLIIAAVLVNLSFLICQLAVETSNIVGDGLRGVFTSISEVAVESGELGQNLSEMSYGKLFTAIGGGTAITVGVGAAVAAVSFEFGSIFMLIPMVLGAFVAVVTGLITIALRQAVVALLIMVSPLAMVTYILPNTEKWFQKWKDLLLKMLIFYPMFSLLFGASQLAGFAIIASARNGLGLLLGMAVEIFPLFFSWSLMKMSGTILGEINQRLNSLAAAPLAANRAWAESRRQLRRADTIANGVTPSAKLMQFLEKRRALREEDTKNALGIIAGKSNLYVQDKIAESEIGEISDGSKRASHRTRNAKAARNYSLMSQNAEANTGHVLTNYGSYFAVSRRDKELAGQSADAWVDYNRAVFQKEIDDENDIKFLTDQYLRANKRDANNNPIDEVAYNRYIRSVAGPDGEQRLISKVITQSSRVESKQRAEYSVFVNKFGHNGNNKRQFRHWLVGYNINDDGWAVDRNGNRLKNEDGTFVETVQGDAITKAPEKLVLYDKRDAQGLYFDFQDQDGNIIARVHRGLGNDGVNHDDAAFIKEVLSNYDIPISDPINNVYGVLSGVNAGSVKTPQGYNEIGLSRYSTTIGRAMANYKGDASWAGSMFNTGIGNRQIHNSAQYAIWVLDSIKKTLKPGSFNTQNPASVEYLREILDPDNFEKIFTEEEIKNAVNINNELYGGEEWDELDENGNVKSYTSVDNPTYEQRLNMLKRKLIFPALKKVLPAFDRLRTSNTADNQKPGTADEQYKFLKMVEEKYENNDAINFDPTLVDQDLQTAARDFRQRKHDKDGNPIYATGSEGNYGRASNLLVQLEDIYNRSMIAEELRDGIFSLLYSRSEYEGALRRFEELCNQNPNATMSEIYDWFDELDTLVNYGH